MRCTGCASTIRPVRAREVYLGKSRTLRLARPRFDPPRDLNRSRLLQRFGARQYNSVRAPGGFFGAVKATRAPRACAGGWTEPERCRRRERHTHTHREAGCAIAACSRAVASRHVDFERSFRAADMLPRSSSPSRRACCATSPAQPKMLAQRQLNPASTQWHVVSTRHGRARHDRLVTCPRATVPSSDRPRSGSTPSAHFRAHLGRPLRPTP